MIASTKTNIKNISDLNSNSMHLIRKSKTFAKINMLETPTELNENDKEVEHVFTTEELIDICEELSHRHFFQVLTSKVQKEGKYTAKKDGVKSWTSEYPSFENVFSCLIWAFDIVVDELKESDHRFNDIYFTFSIVSNNTCNHETRVEELVKSIVYFARFKNTRAKYTREIGKYFYKSIQNGITIQDIQNLQAVKTYAYRNLLVSGFNLYNDKELERIENEMLNSVQEESVTKTETVVKTETKKNNTSKTNTFDKVTVNSDIERFLSDKTVIAEIKEYNDILTHLFESYVSAPNSFNTKNLSEDINSWLQARSNDYGDIELDDRCPCVLFQFIQAQAKKLKTSLHTAFIVMKDIINKIQASKYNGK